MGKVVPFRQKQQPIETLTSSLLSSIRPGKFSPASSYSKISCGIWKPPAYQRQDKRGSRYLKLPDGILTGIIWGCEIGKADKKRFLNWLVKRPTQIKKYEAKKKAGKFALEIKESNE